MEQNLKAGEAYQFTLLNKWDEIIDLSEQYRQLYLGGAYDNEVITKYIAKLTRLWLELYPKVKGRSDLQGLVENYEKYKVYYYEPVRLIKNDMEIIGLEEILREALEALGITKYEK